MNEIAWRRALKNGDSRPFTAIDALEALLVDLKAGKVKMDQVAVHRLDGKEGECYTHHYCVAGLTHQKHIALPHVGLQRTMQEGLK